MKRLALDLFCGGGGAARGLIAAGFEVVGVDMEDHRKAYPGLFVRGDALHPPFRLADFDFVWASPPCQAFSQGNNVNVGVRGRLPNHIPAVRSMLAGHGWTVIENVPSAPIRPDVVLNGPTVGLRRILRKRHFECSFPCLTPPLRPKCGSIKEGTLIPILKNGTPMIESRLGREANGLPRYIRVQEMRDAMGIDDTAMNRRQVGEAIPPAYAEYIAREALRQMDAMAA